MFNNLCFQIDAGLLAEYVAVVAAKAKGQCLSTSKSSNFCAGHIHGRNNHNNILATCINMQVDGRTHHFGHIDLTGNTALFQVDVLGTDAQLDLLLSDIILDKSCLLFIGQNSSVL